MVNSYKLNKSFEFVDHNVTCLKCMVYLLPMRII